MAKTNFYLKSTANNAGENLIMMTFCYDGARLRYSTGETINSKFWNDETQTARKSYSREKRLNEYLSKLKGAVNDIYLKAQANGVNPSLDYLRKELDLFLNLRTPKDTRPKTVKEAWDEFMIAKKPIYAKGTYQQYQQVENNFLF